MGNANLLQFDSRIRVVVQLVECVIWDDVVAGSNPVYPTKILYGPAGVIGSITVSKTVGLGSSPKGRATYRH